MAKKQMTSAEFMALPRKEKAILVAKDVLSQIKAQRISVLTGTYIRIEGSFTREQDVKGNLKKVTSCRVCALGSCIFSTVKFGNTLNFEELSTFDDNKKALRLLRRVFTGSQMMLIEFAFEGWHVDKEDGIAKWELGMKRNAKGLEDCRKYVLLYDDPTDRLSAIMRNIVKNSGVFVP